MSITNLLAPADVLISRISAITKADATPAFKSVQFAASLDEDYLLSFPKAWPSCFLYYSSSEPDTDIDTFFISQLWDFVIATRSFVDINQKKTAQNEAGQLMVLLVNELQGSTLRPDITGFGNLQLTNTPLLPTATPEADGVAFNFLRFSIHIDW